MKYEEMKRKAGEEQDNIELRSEKVRNIIGRPPHFLIRWGNTIIVVIIVLLVAVFFFLKRNHLF